MVLDKLGEYAEAFKLFVDGNKQLEALYKPHELEKNISEYRDEVAAYYKGFNVDIKGEWCDQSLVDKKLKLIFLIGFPRSGTTLTEQILESHDDITATHEIPVIPRLSRRIDEVIGRDFMYPDDISSLNKNEISLLRKEYISEMEKALPEGVDKDKYLLDKLPLNIVHIGLITRIFPEAKILLALRDPRDVCLSCFMQTFKVNQAMRQFLDIKDTVKFYNVVMNNYFSAKEFLKFEDLETRYEDVVDDLESSAKRLIDFVGVEWDDSVLKYHQSAMKRQVHTPSYQGVVQPIYKGSIARWRNYEEQLYPAMLGLNDWLHEFKY